MMWHDKLELSRYRIEKAKAKLETSKLLFDNEKYEDSMNRSYYAIFHMARALTILDEFESRKHSGIIAYFIKNYIKTKELGTEYSDIILNAEGIRNESDYEDMYIATREETLEQLENAEKFLNEVGSYINKKVAKGKAKVTLDGREFYIDENGNEVK